MQSRDKDTLPRFISLPIALFLWILLGLLLVVGGLAWYEQVPSYVSGNGVILNTASASHYASEDGVAVAFFAVDQANHLHIGQRVFVRFASSTQSLKGTLLAVDPVLSPDAATHRYDLDNNGASLIKQPSAVAVIRLDNISSSLYAGSTVTANVQVGSRRIISLVPGIGALFGE